MGKTSKLFLIFYLLFVVNGVAYAEKIKLAAPRITSLIESEGSGYYQKLLSEAYGPYSLPYIETFYPYKRALFLFEQNKVDCIYSFTTVFQEKLGLENILYSYPLGTFSYHVFKREGEPPLQDVSLLSGQRIAGVLGHESYYKAYLPKDVQLELVAEDEQTVNMLERKRFDYIVGALPDLMPYVHRLSFDPAAYLVQNYDRITCHRSQETKEFLNDLSKRLYRLKQQGVYQRLGRDIYMDFKQPLQLIP